MIFDMKHNPFPAALLTLGVVYSLTPWSSAVFALAAGVFVAVVVGNPFADKTKLYAQKLLAYSIIGLGAGMNLEIVSKVGMSGFGYTVISITLTLLLGVFIGKLVKSDSDTSVLISVGTAICGGSAIAALAPVLKAKPHAISVALGTVFLLNALALIIFPGIGHFFSLSQHQFGLWSALAIHDTSSVVGAGLQYGAEALQTGTTVKLARALWIVPLTIGFGYFHKNKEDKPEAKTKKPWFILCFLCMAGIVTWLPAMQEIGHGIEAIARKTLVLTLFLIGANLTLATLKSVGFRPFLQGFLLWILVSAGTLISILLTSS